MRARFVEVLIGQIAVEVIGNPAPQGEQLRAFEPDRSALAEIQQSGDARLRGRKLARDLREVACQLLQQRGREGMEQRDMRVEMIALGRKMRAAQAISPDIACKIMS